MPECWSQTDSDKTWRPSAGTWPVNTRTLLPRVALKTKRLKTRLSKAVRPSNTGNRSHRGVHRCHGFKVGARAAPTGWMFPTCCSAANQNPRRHTFMTAHLSVVDAHLKTLLPLPGPGLRSKTLASSFSMALLAGIHAFVATCAAQGDLQRTSVDHGLGLYLGRRPLRILEDFSLSDFSTE